ncbi:MAG: polysaccharide deacetylase family protein [Microthrixaceae bacterium]|nr:polysaccharide deacetylase family protein [Microthrixaceae bacterium]
MSKRPISRVRSAVGVAASVAAVGAAVAGGWYGVERLNSAPVAVEHARARSAGAAQATNTPRLPESLTATPVSVALERKEQAEQEARRRADAALPERGRWDGNRPEAGSEVHDIMTMPGHADESVPLVALTFDDGPGPYTMDIVDILVRERVPATFFMLGIQVEERPNDARAVAAAGFAIGSHTMDHQDLAKLSPEDAEWEIRESTRIIDETLGRRATRCMRAPYGSFNDDTLRAAKHQGLGLVGWDIDTEDWRVNDASRILARGTRPGRRQLILLHDAGGDRRATVEALPGIIAHYKAEGARFVSVCGEGPPATDGRDVDRTATSSDDPRPASQSDRPKSGGQ